MVKRRIHIAKSISSILIAPIKINLSTIGPLAGLFYLY